MTPVSKGRPRFCRMGKFVRTFTPEATRKAEDFIRKHVEAEWHENPWSGPIMVQIHFSMPIPASRRRTTKSFDFHLVKPDVDNLGKLVSDALNGLCWVDDNQICVMTMTKVYGDEPGIDLTITKLIRITKEP